MALNRTHTANISVDGTYLTITDTTPLADYQANGITDPTGEVTSIIFRITDDSTQTTKTIDLTAFAANLRDSGGVRVLATTLGLSSVFYDDLWVSELDWVAGATYTSTLNRFYFEQVRNKVVVKCLGADWKVSFDMSSRTSDSKNAVIFKSILDRLITADQNGLIEEGRLLLANLKTVV